MNTHGLYPLRFIPQFKQRIWGGTKIQQSLHPQAAVPASCGESWELSDVKGSASVVSEGPHQGACLSALVERYQAQLLGEHVFEKYGGSFPLLVKFIDAHEDLSVQVHPDDRSAQAHHQSRGKAEMWYVLEAEPQARLFTGFEKPLSPLAFLDLVRQERVLEALHKEHVQPGDAFYIPPGRIHSAGKDMFFAEIQETSDITYRIYDFQRRDHDNKARTLHIAEAMRVLDFSSVHKPKITCKHRPNSVTTLLTCPYFTTNKIVFDRPLTRDLRSLDSFVIYLCTQGAATLERSTHTFSFRTGTCLLIPAAYDKKYSLIPQSQTTLLECYIAP